MSYRSPALATASRARKSHHKLAPEKYAPLPKHYVEALLQWAAEILPEDQPKLKFIRGFSDGVMMAKVIHHYRPKFVELNHFWPCSSQIKKRANWIHLNDRVFPKLGFALTPEEIDDIASFTANSIETLLMRVKRILDPNIDSPLILIPFPEENESNVGERSLPTPSQARELVARQSSLEARLSSPPGSIGKRMSKIEASGKANEWRGISDQDLIRARKTVNPIEMGQSFVPTAHGSNEEESSATSEAPDNGRKSILQGQSAYQSSSSGNRLSKTTESATAKERRLKISDQAMYNQIEKINESIQKLRTKMSSTYDFYNARLRKRHQELFEIPLPPRFGAIETQITDQQIKDLQEQLEKRKRKGENH